MSAQQRTLDDLKIGVSVQIDKGGHIRYRQQPQMGLPSIEIIDKEVVAALKRFVRKVHGGPHHTTIDATKCRGLVDWVCDTMDEAATLLTEQVT